MSASARSSRVDDRPIPSPFDPFLTTLLTGIGQRAGGYSPTAEQTVVAGELGWQPAFVDALITSAQRRGFVEVFYPRGARGRSRLRLSGRGLAFLVTHGVVDVPLPPTD